MFTKGFFPTMVGARGHGGWPEKGSEIRILRLSSSIVEALCIQARFVPFIKVERSVAQSRCDWERGLHPFGIEGWADGENL
jgi:hypothetical protein